MREDIEKLIIKNKEIGFKIFEIRNIKYIKSYGKQTNSKKIY